MDVCIVVKVGGGAGKDTRSSHRTGSGLTRSQALSAITHPDI